MLDERAVDEAEIHDLGRLGEMEIVAIAPAAEAVGTLQKFVAHASAPLGCEKRNIRNFLQVETSRIIATNDHGKSVFKTEWLGDFEMEALGVELLDAVIDGGGIALRSFVENGGERRACVLDVEVQLAGEKCFVDKECA